MSFIPFCVSERLDAINFSTMFIIMLRIRAVRVFSIMSLSYRCQTIHYVESHLLCHALKYDLYFCPLAASAQERAALGPE